MIFKKHWDTIIVMVIIAGLFISTAILQSNIPSEPCEDGGQTPPVVEDSVSTAIPESTPYYSHITPPTPTVESMEIVKKPQTSGYDISYVSDEFDAYLIQVMKDFNINIDPSYVYATIFCESTFRESVKSSAGAVGYMQVKPSTRDYIYPMIVGEFQQYSGLSEDLTDPYTNVVYGLYYFSHVAESFECEEVTEENLDKILTCYNRGITGGERYYESVGHWDSEYSTNIMSVAEQIRVNGGM